MLPLSIDQFMCSKLIPYISISLFIISSPELCDVVSFAVWASVIVHIIKYI